MPTDKPIATIAERLSKALKIKEMSQAELVRLTGIGKSSICTYVSGEYEPKQRNIYKIAKALNVSEAWLMGFDVPMQPQKNNNYGIMPITVKSIPFLGEISCGEPIFASEDRQSYVASGVNVKADFCLKAKGDSMINARIYDGDIVFIQKCDTVENGTIAAVVIGDDALLKRVFFYPEQGKLLLVAENTKYPPLVYEGEELNTVKILGKAIAFQSDVR